MRLNTCGPGAADNVTKKNYLIDRKTKTISKYGLHRRTETIIQQFQQHDFSTPCVFLDIGTADGLILQSLTEFHGPDESYSIGIDIKPRYVKSAKENTDHLLQADGRQLPLSDNSVDVIVSTAVFKHVRELKNLIKECHRVLRPDGKMIITDPSPLGIYLGIFLGHFTRQEIVHVLGLDSTQLILKECGFNVIYAGRFMLSPVPFWGSELLERLLKRLRLDQLFFNQVICVEPRCSMDFKKALSEFTQE